MDYLFFCLLMVSLFALLWFRSGAETFTPMTAMIRSSFATAFSNEGDPTELLPTVMIETANGPVRINATDYDPETMTLADETPAPVQPVTPVTPQPVAPMQRLVSSEGSGAKRKFYVVDATGAKLTGEGIESAGYASEGDAWAAITAINAAEQQA